MTFDGLSKLRLSDIMTRKVLAITEDASVYDAALKMNSMNIGAIVILDKAKKVTGIFSERDNLQRVTAEGRNPSEVKVADVMTKNPTILKSDTSVTEAFHIMQNGNFRHLPIVDNNLLVGIISIKDINKILYTDLANILFNNGEKP